MEAAAGSSSRFRLIRFPPPAEQSQRGRWLCRDSYEGGGTGRFPLGLGSPCPLPSAAAPPRSTEAFTEQVVPQEPAPALSARWGLADEEEGAGSGVTAIDNKIERALVRFAVVGTGRDHEEDAGGVQLAAPVPNSSRAAAAARGRAEPFDAPRAAAELLGTSFAARCAVGGAAAAAMNVPPQQRLYRGLVSLAVPPPLAPKRGPLPPSAPHKVPGPAMGSPRGGEEEPWLPPPAAFAPPRPLTRPPGATFVMYRKLQQWGGA